MHIVCIASCLVGIAHTYIAAANLGKAVKTKGHEVKVGTQGAQGVEDEITTEDTGRVDGCIITGDIRIKNSGRFEPVPTPTVGVGEAVKNTKAIVEELLETVS